LCIASWLGLAEATTRGTHAGTRLRDGSAAWIGGMDQPYTFQTWRRMLSLAHVVAPPPVKEDAMPVSRQHPADREGYAPALAAALVLAIGMGYGRFAFTGLYPLMVSEGTLTVHTGTLAASSHYAGYLLGALLVARVRLRDARWLCIASMATSIASMAVLFFFHTAWPIIVVRGLAGLFSAVSMVAASLWLLQYMGHARRAPLLYSGVGIGIVVSAELIALGRYFGMDSAMLWMGLAISCVVLAVAALPGLNRVPAHDSGGGLDATHLQSGRAATLCDAVLLIVIYGLAGYGYIVTATYLPLLIKDALGPVDPIQVWAVFGVGAVPACFLWYACHVRFGTRSSLILNLLVQAVGVALPAVSHTAVSYLASAFLVGGTFVGVVTIVMPAARRLAKAVRFSMPAGLTASYGVGQIIGPLVASEMYASSQSFTGSLLTAAGALVAAAILCLRI
jgi:hypothetical protein